MPFSLLTRPFRGTRPARPVRSRLRVDRLEDRCKQWITGVRSQFAGTPVAPQETPPVGPLAFKMT